MELNIRIQREEASTGDIKSGRANSTLAEDKDSGINPERGGDGGIQIPYPGCEKHRTNGQMQTLPTIRHRRTHRIK